MGVFIRGCAPLMVLVNCWSEEADSQIEQPNSREAEEATVP
jgi:hypothetical protein